MSPAARTPKFRSDVSDRAPTVRQGAPRRTRPTAFPASRELTEDTALATMKQARPFARSGSGRAPPCSPHRPDRRVAGMGRRAGARRESGRPLRQCGLNALPELVQASLALWQEMSSCHRGYDAAARAAGERHVLAHATRAVPPGHLRGPGGRLGRPACPCGGGAGVPQARPPGPGAEHGAVVRDVLLERASVTLGRVCTRLCPCPGELRSSDRAMAPAPAGHVSGGPACLTSARGCHSWVGAPEEGVRLPRLPVWQHRSAQDPGQSLAAGSGRRGPVGRS